MATQTTTTPQTPKPSPAETAIALWETSHLRTIVLHHEAQLIANAGERRVQVEDSARAFQSAMRRLLVTNPQMALSIAKQNPGSVRDAFEYVGALGLRVGQGYDAQVWLIPRTIKDVPTLGAQIGTRGMQVLADRAGWRVKALPVSVADVDAGRLVLRDAEVHYTPDPMTEPLDAWDPDEGWKNLAGFVVFAGRNGSPMADGYWVSVGTTARRRAMSQQANGNFWKKWPIEMARGVAIRHVCKQIGGESGLGQQLQQISDYEGNYLRSEEASQDPMQSLRAAIAQPPTFDVTDAPVETVRRPETMQAPQNESDEDRYNREQDELFARQHPPSGK